MDHSGSEIFYRNYLSRMIRYDTMASFLGKEARTDWILHAHSMSRSLDTRRPKELTPEQRAAILKEPEIQKLARRKAKRSRRISDLYRSIRYARGTRIHDKYQDAEKAYRAALHARERAAFKQVLQDYDAIAPLQDLRMQLEGDNKVIKQTKQPQPLTMSPHPERLCLANAFLDIDSFRQNERLHRISVVDSMIALCGRQSLHVRRRRQRQACPVDALDGIDVGASDQPDESKQPHKDVSKTGSRLYWRPLSTA